MSPTTPGPNPAPKPTLPRMGFINRPGVSPAPRGTTLEDVATPLLLLLYLARGWHGNCVNLSKCKMTMTRRRVSGATRDCSDLHPMQATAPPPHGHAVKPPARLPSSPTVPRRAGSAAARRRLEINVHKRKFSHMMRRMVRRCVSWRLSNICNDRFCCSVKKGGWPC